MSAKSDRTQNLFGYILGIIFFVPMFMGVAAVALAGIVLSPIIWLVEGRGKAPPPEVVPPPMQMRPTPGSEEDARSLEIQDGIEAEARKIAWEQIRAANAKSPHHHDRRCYRIISG